MRRYWLFVLDVGTICLSFSSELQSVASLPVAATGTANSLGVADTMAETTALLAG